MAERIDRKEVEHIARLARLELAEDEITRFGRQLSSILEYMEKLNEVNTDHVEPTAHALAVHNVFREDQPTESLGVDRALANAPVKAPPFFKVPKVLNQDPA